jgi:hypothetical protein
MTLHFSEEPVQSIMGSLSEVQPAGASRIQRPMVNDRFAPEAAIRTSQLLTLDGDHWHVFNEAGWKLKLPKLDRWTTRSRNFGR